MNHKILIVDDEAANLRLLERLFRREYQVVSATSGGEALELLQQHDVALIISDQRMPGMTGIEFLKRAFDMRRNTVRIILTGYTDVNSLVEAINSGVVYKYVTKPWVNEDLQQTVSRAIEHYEINRKRHELEVQNERLESVLKRSKQSLVRFIADTIGARDEFLHGHMRRTSNYAVAVGQRLGLDDAELEQLSLAAFLHEVGHLYIPDDVLRKTSPLTDEEHHVVKNSVARGARTLVSLPELNNIAAPILHHKERFDGGEQIPFFARVIAVADSYDQMTATTCGDSGLTHEEAIEQLRRASGKRFDPNVVEAFCQLTAIAGIRRAVQPNKIGMCLLPSRVLGGSGEPSTAELLRKIETEPMLALEILKTANRASSGETTAKLREAVARIGEDGLRRLVRENGLSSLDEKTNERSTVSRCRAVAAQFLAAHTEIIHPEEAYTLGLLYDAGETLLFSLFPNEMAALDDADEELRRRNQIATFGTDAAQISQWMLEACRLPARLTADIGTHQEEMRSGSPIANLIYLADKIAKSNDADKFSFVESFGAEAETTMNLSRADFRAVCSRTHSFVEAQTNAEQNAYEYAG